MHSDPETQRWEALCGPPTSVIPGGAGGARTPDLLNAIQTRSQLRHCPAACAPLPDVPQPINGLAPEHESGNGWIIADGLPLPQGLNVARGVAQKSAEGESSSKAGRKEVPSAETQRPCRDPLWPREGTDGW